MRRLHLGLVATLAVALAACSAGHGSTGTVSGPSASASTDGTSDSPAEVTVKLTDALKMEPASFSVKAGVAVRFVVRNSGATDHEFYLGDEAAQAAHEQEMSGMAGMGHDDPAGIGLKAGETKAFEYTFAKAGSYLAGCHVNGHYAGGMKATITVTE